MKMDKKLSVSGGFADPSPGALPLDPADGSTPDPHLGLCSMCSCPGPPLANPGSAAAAI